MSTRRSPVRVAIVPHTHWDREWYSAFQTFRLRLVRLLDALLPMLESDLSYSRFLLDGQTAVIDDYLAIRPEAAPTLARLASSGRLAIGPWMVLMDEFMVSGETMVRDLQFGIARGSELGGVMDVGYLPDMFGHVAQMPQLLRLAGFEHAVVWRGVPAAVEQTAFWWEAPDGSRVRAEYLYGSYSNGRDLPDDAKQLVLRARDYEHELGPARLGDMLMMNGTDHQMPQPWLGRVVAEANAQQDEYEFAVTSLPEYLADQTTAGLVTVEGELRSGARANLLMGVASNRVDVHRACARAERSLEKRAEPLSALFLPAAQYPYALTDVAWRKLVLNSAHDSSCACSSDEVVDQVLVRYYEARQIGDGLTHDAIRALAGQVAAPVGATVVANPTARPRSGLVDARVPGTGPCHFVGPGGAPHTAQVLDNAANEGFQTMVTGQKVRWVLDLMRASEFAGRQIHAYEVTPVPNTSDQHDILLIEARGGDERIDLTELKEQMLALGEAGQTISLRVQGAPVRRVLFDTGEIDGFGWSSFTVVEGPAPVSAPGATTDGGVLANEFLRVSVDPADGTYTIESPDGLRIAGCGRLVDDGDGGDTYNYSPPDDNLVVDRPDAVRIHTGETGPVRAQLVIDADYSWPAFAIGDVRLCTARSQETVRATVRTTLELRRGERFLRVTHEIDNHARDHRLRVHFPLPTAVTGSDAECAFAVVHRGLTAEGGVHEFGLPTFPSRRFVDASDGAAGLALLHEGLLEYEVVDGGRGIALTLLRAVGYLSRTDPQLRPNPAGPPDPLEGPQLQGSQRAEYAVLVHAGDWRSADCFGAADAFLVPFERARVAPHTDSSRPSAGSALRVDGAEVSAVQRVPGGLVVRVFRTAADAGSVTVEHEGVPARGFVIDLRGQPVVSFEGEVELRPFEIATLQITDHT
ncbi:MAG TPA: glycoside hydrolase family 38 C-terminal domain-containing protein [Acidimicrobiia bacterium]|nr:glycoside hydrolase family 38 C-terminal domain-containing protein [Acidimicrobiia bacterium]